MKTNPQYLRLKLPPLRIPVSWLEPNVLLFVAIGAVGNAQQRFYNERFRHQHADDTYGGYSEVWWQETRRMIDRGYRLSCIKHGIDPDEPSWRFNERGAL